MNAIKVVRLVQHRVWIEQDALSGTQHVMLQSDQPGADPFCYASLHYNYRYTDNAAIRAAAEAIAIGLGASEPVEHRMREMPDAAAIMAAYQRIASNTSSAAAVIASDVWRVAEHLAANLEAAVQRFMLANAGGDPIHSAAIQDAIQAISAYELLVKKQAAG